MTKTNTKDEFIEKSNLRHNNRYNYDNVVYITNKKKVLVGCPEHGDFWIRPDAHICGRGCRKCSYVSRFVKGKSTRASNYVSKCKEVHGDVYDYTKTKYTGVDNKVTITCRLHGEFLQNAKHHMNGHGCPKCTSSKTGKIIADCKFETNSKTFISKAKKIHGDVYDYTKTFYKTATEKVTITCKKHGEYKITPSNHLAGSGCKLCGREKTRNSLKSAHENLLFKLLSLVFDDIEQSNRKILRGLEIDILRYSNKKCIEFNGDYWHCNPNKYSSDFKIIQSNKTATEIWESDKNKRILLNSLGYDLLVVWESDWKQDKMKIMEMCIEFLQGV
jgi:G:T-mismatch repair DNA endonuclease (very short patch repair protein)